MMSLIKNNPIYILITIFSICLQVKSSDAYYTDANFGLFLTPEMCALGNSNLSYSRDVTTSSNPANLPLERTNELSMSYAGYYKNSFSTSLISFITSASENTGIGISMGYLYIPDIEKTSNLETEVTTSGDTVPIYDPLRISITSASDLLLNFSLGHNFKLPGRVNWSLGGLLHCLRRRLPSPEEDVTGYGIGLDAGTTLSFEKTGIRLSALVRNLTTNYIYWNSDYHDAGKPQLLISAGFQKKIEYLYGTIGLYYTSPDILINTGTRLYLDSELDELKERQGDFKEDPLFFIKSADYGFQWIIQETVAVRIGAGKRKLSFGAGINIFDSMNLDFSFTTSELPGTYMISLGYLW